MSDLISRSALLEELSKREYSREKHDFEILIKNQPTAYNVDAVVEQIHDELFCYDIPVDIVDDVIRKGGV